MKDFKLEIVTPTGVIYDSDVNSVTLPGVDGEFGVLADHASLVSLLDAGVIIIETTDDRELAVAINSGYVKVDETKTLCVVDGAVALSSEDSELAKAIDEAKELLQKSHASSTAIATAVSKVERIASL